CASVTTPTSRRRDVRASTATAPAADEERGVSPSPPLPYHRVSNHQHPPRTPHPPPSTLPRALPASSDPHGHDREPRPTESCRFSASQPSDSPPRHATSRAACVSLHRVSKACEREKPYRAFLVP
ncbi:hypothetical protein ALC62_13246, partial [Cyphomyrmex costatus]